MIVSQDISEDELTLFFNTEDNDSPLLTVFDAAVAPNVGDSVVILGEKYTVVDATFCFYDERTDIMYRIERCI